MNLKIGLFIATGTVIAGMALGPAPEPAFAQARPMLSQAAVEQELVTVATQMAANPNGYTNATLIGAEAQGLTLSLRFRLKNGTSLTVEQYGAQVTTGFCQNAAFRQYTDQHGVVLDINVTAARGNGVHRFQIDRAACARTVGGVNLPPASQGPVAQSAPSEARPAGSATFDFKGVPLGLSYDDFRRLPHPDGAASQVVCTGEQLTYLGVAVTPLEVTVYSSVQRTLGVRRCVWISTDSYAIARSAPLRLAGSGYATIEYSFSFVPDPRDGVLQLYQFEGLTNRRAEDAIIEALAAKFGTPEVTTGVVQNGIGNRFDQITAIWSDATGSLLVQSPSQSVDRMTILMMDTRLSRHVAAQEAAAQAAIPNGI